MNDSVEIPETDYECFGASAPSPITGIGFRPTRVSKGGFVLDVKAYQDGEAW